MAFTFTLVLSNCYHYPKVSTFARTVPILKELSILFTFLLSFITAPVKNLRTLPKHDKLWVGWTAPNSYVLKYVIEWCLVSSSSDCIIEWQIAQGDVQGIDLKGI